MPIHTLRNLLHEATMPITKAKEDARTRGHYFGAELAASASLHLLSYVGAGRGSNADADQKHNISNPLLWENWCEQDHMHDGRIRKAKMFNFAVDNSSILPFGFSQKSKLHRFQNLKNSERLSYAPFTE